MAENPPIRVLSIYDSFFLGGARILHSHVVRELHSNFGQLHSVLSLTDRVNREQSLQLAQESLPWKSLEEAGVELSALNREPGDHYSKVDLEAIQLAVDRADVVLILKEQALEGLESIDFPPSKPLFLSLHRSDPEHQGRGPETIFEIIGRQMLTGAICCAESTRDAYIAAGIPDGLLSVIPNGIDLERFHPRPKVRKRLREELGIGKDFPVVLIAARYDEMKNIPLFLESAAHFLRLQPDAHFVLCGSGMGTANGELMAKIGSLSGNSAFPSRVHALGSRSDMEDIHTIADLISLTSAFGEAAPLCLLEGMASGSIPLATPIGDCAMIVGDPRLITGFEPQGIARQWLSAWQNRDEHLSRILANRDGLSDHHMIRSYAELIGRAAKID